MSALQVTAIVVSYAFLLVGVGLLVRAVARFVKVFAMGAPDPRRTDHPGRRTMTLTREFLGHTRMARLPLVAAAHWVTMISFGLLFLTLVTAFGQVLNPSFALPLIGHFPPFEWVTELFAWGGLVGILYLIVVRQKNLPRRAGDGGRRSRFFGSTFWQAYYVEYTILGVVVCIIALRALEYALFAAQGSDLASPLHFPLTAWLGSLFAGASVATLSAWIYVVATIKIVISFAWMITISLTLTMGVAWHRFLAFFNIWFKRHADGRTSLGPLQPLYVDGTAIDAETLEDVMDSDDGDIKMGVGAVEDFTWKGLLDFTTCTECGRCQSQCPAWNTDKPLSPKLLVMALRDHAYAKAPFVLASESQRESLPEPVGAIAQMPLVGATGYAQDQPLQAYNARGADAVIDEDVLWSCTTCGACVEQCPVDIEHVDSIVDMRRNQVLIESAFPAELGGLFKNMEGKQNPWGMAPKLRLDWAKGLPFDVPVVGSDVESLQDVDYLFWVGCAGAYEDRAKKTTRAVAELLHTADVSFAVLGEGEACTGDSARRAGNEILYQMLAAQNIETLDEAGATKIVVTCAHCFNTLKNEYPQTGGNYDVVHHTQLLNRLVREKRLVPVARPDEANSKDVASTASSVTYHDPCYLGRHNHVYAPPRELIATLPGVELREMPRHGEKSFCCGAGGARMWMEEKLGSRINRNRTAEAVATGADRIAVGCPFCRVMLSDGLTAEQSEGTAREEVEVVDIAQMLLAAVRRGEETAPDESSAQSVTAAGEAESEVAAAAAVGGDTTLADGAAEAGAPQEEAPPAPKKQAMSASDALAAMQPKGSQDDGPPAKGTVSASDALAAMQAGSDAQESTPAAPAKGKMSASDALAAMQAQGAAQSGGPTAESTPAPAKGKMSASDALAAMQAQGGAASNGPTQESTPAAPAKGKISASDALAAMQAQAGRSESAEPAAQDTPAPPDTAPATSATPAAPAAPAAPAKGKMSASDALAAMQAQAGRSESAEPAAQDSPAPSDTTSATPAAPTKGKMSASEALAAMQAQAGVAKKPASAAASESPTPPGGAAPIPAPADPAAPSEPAGPAAHTATAPRLSGTMSASEALAAMQAQTARQESPARPEPTPATQTTPPATDAKDSTAPATDPDPTSMEAPAPPAVTSFATDRPAPPAEAPERADSGRPADDAPAEVSGPEPERAGAPDDTGSDPGATPGNDPESEREPQPESTTEPAAGADASAPLTGKMSASEALKRMRGEL